MGLEVAELNKYRILSCDNILNNYYAINEFGKIMNIKRKCEVKSHQDKDGYLHLMLCTNDIGNKNLHTRKDFKVATLVIKSFMPNYDLSRLKDPTVDHIDGNVLNNHYSNLRWVERGYNSSIRKIKPFGKINGSCKLNENEVIEIKRMLQETKLPNKEIAKQFDISPSVISSIKRNIIWKWI